MTETSEGKAILRAIPRRQVAVLVLILLAHAATWTHLSGLDVGRRRNELRAALEEIRDTLKASYA